MDVSTNPYAAPGARLTLAGGAVGPATYVGFWARVLASLVDSVLVSLITLPILWKVYGPSYFTAGSLVAGPLDFLLSWVFPAAAVLCFWMYRSATPGKIVMKARIVDAVTGDNPSPGQCLIRYFGYFVSTIPLGIGLLWVAFDSQKQGWHDKLARTLVIKD